MWVGIRVLWEGEVAYRATPREIVKSPWNRLGASGVVALQILIVRRSVVGCEMDVTPRMILVIVVMVAGI